MRWQQIEEFRTVIRSQFLIYEFHTNQYTGYYKCSGKFYFLPQSESCKDKIWEYLVGKIIFQNFVFAADIFSAQWVIKKVRFFFLRVYKKILFQYLLLSHPIQVIDFQVFLTFSLSQEKHWKIQTKLSSKNTCFILPPFLRPKLKIDPSIVR